MDPRFIIAGRLKVQVAGEASVAPGVCSVGSLGGSSCLMGLG